MVAHSNALVSAGLIAMIRRISGCSVHASESVDVNAWLDLRLPVIDVLIADSAALAKSVACRQGGAASHALAGAQIVLMTAAAETGAAASMPPGVSACLSMHCQPDDLLNAVRGLIGTPMIAPVGGNCIPNVHVRTLGPARQRARGGMAPGTLRRVREHIEVNLAEHLQLRDLSALTDLSPCHFSRAFKQSVGMPPHRYLMSRRISAAAKLIETTDRPMCDIALEVGFSDQSHFTRVFSAQIGESPRSFRHLRR